MSAVTLLAVPNFAEGRRAELLGELSAALRAGSDGTGSDGARLLDLHCDPDHNRSVFTLAGGPGQLAGAVLAAARPAVECIDIRHHDGAHPTVGALDVAPIVYLRDRDIGAACAEALVLADLLGERLELPVFLYGGLADGRSRSELRRGGSSALAARIEAGELVPDFGPRKAHRTAGAVLVAARPPLVAFNVELAPPATLGDARRIAATIRQGGPEGLDSVRAIGVWLAQRGVAQVSTNIEDHRATPPAEVLAAVRRDARVLRAELVGLAPAQALEGLPADVPLEGRATIEEALAASEARGEQAPG